MTGILKTLLPPLLWAVLLLLVATAVRQDGLGPERPTSSASALLPGPVDTTALRRMASPSPF